ncbi:TetR/AcrR family transcriptional regulator [Amycolatopsis sp. K13G38]|uniref:TetR/AcrR family transcriptional regulator n=1 Tax=Amycolatopsis acididurans TaxID=2724524 RepID=A0ABX1J571_9PSEU|nr:TetR/AcrR family transcriptional regulator [Amycolatopsis acididurans]NKQ54948.1 TetR/AcrR family transcriptional regulator [Amycolatopsis acididurans]
MGTRERILAAATEIMREQGYARATTKEIARAAGFSEAALYKHFRDKTEIFLGVLSEQLPPLGVLDGQAGKSTVRANLTRFTRAAVDFYARSFPIAASVFSTRELLAAHRSALQELDAGPRRPLAALAQYLREEQKLDRLARSADVDAMAALLFGACFQQAFLLHFDGEEPSPDMLDGLAKSLVRTLLNGVR